MASISPDDALILPYRANPRRMEFSGTTGKADATIRHSEPKDRLSDRLRSLGYNRVAPRM
jgi:hypothetical protein